jgi:hypothetical protein
MCLYLYIWQIVRGTEDRMAVYKPIGHPQNITLTEAKSTLSEKE